MSFVEREHPRYAHHAEISTIFAGRQVVGTTVNVSRGGLCVLLDTELPIGSDLTIELALRFEDGAQSEAISVSSRVVWCTAIDAHYQVGLALRNVDAEVQAHLEMFLRFLGAAAPG